MGLQFLVPAILTGLAILVVPIVIHLTRRQRSRVVEFPSLMFLERIPYRSMRRRKIRNWVLLLLRAAALGMLVVAFARPLFTDVDLEAGTVLGPRDVVIILDRSYSMSLAQRWPDALAAARSTIAGLQPIDRASLIFMDARAEAVVRSSSDVDPLARELDEATVGSMGTRFSPALKLAESILVDSNLPNREVVFISDFQRAGWGAEEDAALPLGTLFTPVDVSGEDGSVRNLTVADLDLRRDVFSGRERVSVGARVLQVGGSERGTVSVTLSVDGRELERQLVEVDREGSAGVAFEAFTLADPFTTGEVRVEGDAFSADDIRRFVVSPGRSASVLLVRGTGSQERATLYLTRALDIPGAVPYRTDVRGQEALDSELAERSVVIVTDTPLPSGRRGAALMEYVASGGGLLLILGENGRVPGDLAELVPAQILDPVDRTPAGRLGYLDYSHPVFEPFAGPDGGDFSRARFYRYRALQPRDDAQVLARFDDGVPAMVAGRFGAGRVVVFASSADNFWNDLVLQPLFLPLLHQTVAFLRNDTPVPDFRVAGDVLDLSTPESLGLRASDELPTGARSEGERVALAPSGATIPVLPVEEQPFLDMVEQGFYVIRAPGSDEARPVTVAVNVDVAESDLRSMDPEELSLGIQAAAGVAEDGGDEAGSSILRTEDLERRQGLWRFLLVGAFVLLVLETVLSNRLSRGSSGVGGGVNA